MFVRAGYYTGGNLFARNQVYRSELGSIQLPSYKAGCGGIDMFTGAFSFINGNQLVQTLKGIGSNAEGLFYMIALESLTPIIKNNVEYSAQFFG